MKIKAFYVITILLVCAFSSPAGAEWHFGIGTGPSFLTVDGDLGLNSNIAGPVKVSMDADPDSISDVTDSAIGFGGYASKGKWTIQGSYGCLDLEGSHSTGVMSIAIDFEITKADFLVSYAFYQTNKVKLDLIGGVRYTEHDIKSDFCIGAIQEHVSIDNDWTDAVIGLSAIVPLHPKVAWKTSADAGFGGSEGTYTANTGLTWRFYKGWSATLSYNFSAVEFEESTRGAADWYLYDMNEQTFGLVILYNW